MGNKTAIFVFGLASIIFFSQAVRAQKLLADGFGLAGVDGKLSYDANSEAWLFEPDADIKAGDATVPAGTQLEMLRSSALEKITANADGGKPSYYRLWGRMSSYRGRNFIFAIYFLSLSKPERSEPNLSGQPAVVINEPDDELSLPEHIVERLSRPKMLRPEQLEKPVELKDDYILADGAGFIEEANGQVKFVLDCIGQNVGKERLGLLKCEVLERVQQAQSVEAETIRFKAAGIVTQYKGQRYLLLQRATRLYSNGNFD